MSTQLASFSLSVTAHIRNDLPRPAPIPIALNYSFHSPKPSTHSTARSSRKVMPHFHVMSALGGEDSSPGVSHDLLIVGAGVLGRLVAQEWKQKFPGSRVVGQTRTTNHHDELVSLGIEPTVRHPEGSQKYPFVIFCAPPSGSEDYPSKVRLATEQWNGQGSFLFTSSSAMYDVSDNGPCSEENSPIIPLGRSPRTDRLILAESEALAAGGVVVRLAGLYLLDRGAHTYWLSRGFADARPDHYVNLIHYEDAASLCVRSLTSKSDLKVFMGCDGRPVTRQEVMDSVIKSGKYEGKFNGFTTSDGALGKKMSNEVTKRELNWEPKYPSFASFLGIDVL